MKRVHFWMLGALVVVSALLVGATLKARRNPLYQLSRYPQTPAFKRHIFHVSSELENPLVGTKEALLQINAPTESDFTEVSGVEIQQSGRFSLDLLYPTQSKGGSARFSDLQPQQLAKIKKLMRQLPQSRPPTKRKNLLIVLLYQPQPAQIRLYDQRDPPAQIREIVALTTKIISGETHNSNSQRAVN